MVTWGARGESWRDGDRIDGFLQSKEDGLVVVCEPREAQKGCLSSCLGVDAATYRSHR
jgi:hypothetical protein